MSVTFFKRYRMEVNLPARGLTFPVLPPGYRLVPWKPSLVEAHVRAKFESFRNEIDARVFPCFGQLDGCRLVMQRIIARDGFLPETTWLAVYELPEGGVDYCGTIQGIRAGGGLGSIQNVGVAPEHRHRGLARALLHRSLDGFLEAGLRRVYLEVTADNGPAVRLYQQIGFQVVKTLYKEVPTPL